MIMDEDFLNFIKLETHDTKDARDQHVNGTLTVVWRDWDKIIKNHPKMVYVTSVNPRRDERASFAYRRIVILYASMEKLSLL